MGFAAVFGIKGMNGSGGWGLNFDDDVWAQVVGEGSPGCCDVGEVVEAADVCCVFLKMDGGGFTLGGG